MTDFVQSTCAAIMRRRIDNYDTLPAAQRTVFEKDMAGIIADTAEVLASTMTGRWLDGATDEFKQYLLKALVVLEIEMKEGAQF